MKTYKVQLLDQQGNQVIQHNLFAKSKKDADTKCRTLLENCRDKTVVSYHFSESEKKQKKESKRKNKQYTLESWMMANGKEGDVFYSEKLDRHLTAIAVHHSRKIATERVLVVTTAKSSPECRYLVRVTLL